MYPNVRYRYSESTQPISQKDRDDYGLKSDDAFLTKRVTAVHYWYNDSMWDVASSYESLLPSLGWRKVRGLHPWEKTLCGGDWVGVYEKDGRMFKIHACGAQGLDPEVIEQGHGQFLTYYFYRTRPESVLGKDYRDASPTAQSLP